MPYNKLTKLLILLRYAGRNAKSAHYDNYLLKKVVIGDIKRIMKLLEISPKELEANG